MLYRPTPAHLLAYFRRPRVARATGWLTLLALLPLVVGCNYYWAKQREVSSPALSTLAVSKQFLVHQGPRVWQLNNPHLMGEVLAGELAEVPPLVRQYRTPVGKRSVPYKKMDESVVLNLVHLYLADNTLDEKVQASIPLGAIQRIDLVEKDTGTTTVMSALAGVGAAVGVLVLITVIVALTKSSCPFIYAYDGRHYQFVGEAYGGALFAPSERNDYLPLPTLRPEQQQYRLKITNELKERQYTNLAELWVVAHPDSTQVLLDQRGHVQTITRPQAPYSALSLGGADCTRQLRAVDHHAYLFDEATPDAAPTPMVLTFARPAAARAGKLVLRAQNSLWLDYLYGEFTKQFGSYYTAWAKTQATVPAQELRQWSRDQSIPLTVLLETTHGWREVESIPAIGPLAARDLVVPLDLTDVPAGPVRVRLQTGFRFWELDYAALDCSAPVPVRLTRHPPTQALDEHGRDQRANLAADDARYLVQPRPGTEVRLAYPAPAPAPHTRHTAFLRTKGYYEHVRDYQGLPDLPALYAFKKPGRFVEFSREKYQQAAQQLQLASNQ